MTAVHTSSFSPCTAEVYGGNTTTVWKNELKIISIKQKATCILCYCCTAVCYALALLLLILLVVVFGTYIYGKKVVETMELSEENGKF